MPSRILLRARDQEGGSLFAEWTSLHWLTGRWTLRDLLWVGGGSRGWN